MAFSFEPRLLNSASPWATTYEDLKALYDCPHTGAVTVRTSMLGGFSHSDDVHQYCFFDAGGSGAKALSSDVDADAEGESRSTQHGSSLNTLGYSPIPLEDYLVMVKRIADESGGEQKKPFILSVTGTADEVAMAYRLISQAAAYCSMAMEINLSCPNIKDHPPPGYDFQALEEYLHVVGDWKAFLGQGGVVAPAALPVGIKTPPYTYTSQFEKLIETLAGIVGDEEDPEAKDKSVIDFITATNTLGSSLVLSDDLKPTLASEAGTGLGGLAGAALHPLSLGNVATLRKLLDQTPQTKHVQVIGVGGVSDRGGYERMRHVGAHAVGLATALGTQGLGVFEKIMKE